MGNKTALYLRLSREDTPGSASQSIQNQREFLLHYAQQHGFCIVDIYQDDGYTGTNFNRPGFLRLRRDIECGRIDTVLTKDLSRLGRDYITTGYYLEQYFPLHQVRYIAVSDGIDTGLAGMGDDMSPFRAVFNDMYAKDISKKVRTALDTKKRSGQFIGSTAPFGYRKSAENKNRLVPDEMTAPYVRRVFTLFLGGLSLRATACALTREGIPTPSQAAGSRRAATDWNETMVRRIVSNPTYIGELTQNRSRKLSYKLQKRKALPQQEWIVVPGTHAPLVCKEDFAAAQRLLAKRSLPPEGRKRKIHALSGLVFCADCGKPMTFVQDGARYYLVCSTWKRYAKDGRCTAHRIREDRLESAVAKTLQRLVFPHIPWSSFTRMTTGSNVPSAASLINAQNSFATLYQDKASGLISDEEFCFLADRFRRQIAQANKPPAPPNISQDQLRQLFTFTSLSSPLLRLLVTRIMVGSQQPVSLFLSFRQLPEAPVRSNPTITGGRL